MTRFARAKGSKSSNERVPEDSTPWEVMKEQLVQAKKENEESKKREEAEKQRIENYENFLKEQKTQKRKATWCDFPETAVVKPKVSQQLEPPSKKKKNKEKKANKLAPVVPTSDIATENDISATNKKLKKKNKNNGQSVTPNSKQSNDTDHNDSPTNKLDNNDTITPSKKKLKKVKQNQNSEQPPQSEQTENNEQITNLGKKNKNKKNKKQKAVGEGNDSLIQENNNNAQDAKNNKTNNNKKKNKETKFVDGVPVRRKPVEDRSFQLIINGKEVELVRFDGFPIMKKDAERLQELKTNMIKKGIPKSEVNRTLKLERRRAEKALARLKRDVCYNCRKGGHNLSDCPDLKTKIPGSGAPDGVCFKCGSTEHRQFECKVQKDKEFRFATCFICKEPGHIARQCPDNPKGLYPNGGGCKLCGDVTHLRKDCPTIMDKKEETSIKLQTLNGGETLEGIESTVPKTQQETNKKPKKIKF